MALTCTKIVFFVYALNKEGVIFFTQFVGWRKPMMKAIVAIARRIVVVV